MQQAKTSKFKAIMKQWMPAVLKPLAREILYRSRDAGWRGRYAQEVAGVAEQWRQVVANTQLDVPQKGNLEPKLKTLFLTGFGIGAHYQAIEPVLMMALLARGVDIVSFYCNTTLPACEFNSTGNNKPLLPMEDRPGLTKSTILAACRTCSANVHMVYHNLPISRRTYDQYIKSTDYDEASKIAKNVDFSSFRQWMYEGIAVGEEAYASVLRATFTGTVDDTPRGRRLAYRYLVSGIIMARAMERALRDIRPDRVMLIHGLYLTHGIGLRVARKLGIPSVVIGGGGIRKDTAIFCHNETYHHQLVNESNSLWENAELTRDQRANVLNYAFNKRHAGSGVDYLNYHPNPVESEEEVLRELGIDRSRKIVSAYTNVIWDAQIVYSSNVFQDIFDWIFSTIELLGRNKNVWLIIRIHPAEVKSAAPTRQPMLAEIKKRFPVLPDNVKIIPPESDISSYTLAQMSVASIIYGTKMGLELGLMKVPLIICGETFSRNKGYGLDVTSRDQYSELLAKIESYAPDTERAFERALKYAHYLYFRKMIDLPFTTGKAGVVGSGRSLNFNSLADLAPGKNPKLDKIIDGILRLTPLHLD